MKAAAGFAVLVDDSGKMLAVLRDEERILGPNPEGAMLGARLVPGSLGPFLDMLLEIRGVGAAFDRELLLQGENGPTAFHFVASRLGKRTVVVASAVPEGIFPLFEDLVRANGELINLLRSGAKSGEGTSSGSADRPLAEETWDEISRLNNELVNSRRDLSHANAELQRLDALKNRFLGMAAHDLRNPIAVIVAYADYLLDQADLPEAEWRHALESVKRKGEFMQALVEDLLDTSAIESGALHLKVSAADLAAITVDAAETLKPLAARRGVRVELRLEDCITVCADPVRMAQAIGNLVSNAIKFSARDSTVAVAGGSDGDEVFIRVYDRGPGMNEEQLKLLGTPFGTTTAWTPEGEKTTGLGALIARRIAEAHGGRILYRSVPGEGTVAELRIPALVSKACDP